MSRSRPRPLVHLELHTGDAPRASAFYAELLQWRPERVASYLTLDVGTRVGGGIAACPVRSPVWLPYVAVEGVDATTERACALGATVLLAPRGGPAGRRSVIGSPAGGEVALWEAGG
jgi:predicted enzyme related to lactoylglutathione lyase